MEENFALIWKHIADAIRPEVSVDTFQRWFKAIQLIQADETQLTLRVPNNIYQLWIETNYLPLVQSAVLMVLGSPRKLHFTVGDVAQKAEPKELEESIERKPVKAPKQAADAFGAAPKAPAAPRESGDAAGPSSPVANTGMNPRNTFETFVVGSNNQFAHAAALAVAQNPSKTYNPLFVYGGVGLGKTHLMHAIGQHIGSSTKKPSRVLYISSERFTNEFIDAIQNSKLVKFRNRYRQADVLLIDDIQFLAGKERSQEEFFHTFNTLFDGHKQIILSSDRPPSEIQNLEARLVSRFEWGLTAELQPPDIETRVAILRKKALALHIKLDNSVIDFLAQRIRTNVRRLEGALMRVASFTSLSGRELTTDAVEIGRAHV